MYKKTPVLIKENIILGLPSESRDEAIKRAGQVLIDSGYVSNDYIDAMLQREEIVSTYIGNGVAIPHGVGKARDLILSSGLVVLQYPDGIDFNGNTCYIVIGISGKDNDHIKILSKIAEQISDEDDAKALWSVNDAAAVYDMFSDGE